MMVSVLMFFSAFVALYYNIRCGESDFLSLLIPSILTLLVGFVLYMFGRNSSAKLRKEDNYVMVTLTWLTLTILGMLPYIINGTTDNITDAFFETISGFTTTGATVLTDIDFQPHGILLWRSITQWLGGLGVIVLTMAFFSQSNKTYETQLFSAETTGLEVDKLGSRIRSTAQKIWVVYIVLTVLCFVAYRLGPMSTFDAFCHAMTTAATGGFSTHQASMAYWDSPYLEYMCCLFMFLCALNFSLYYFLIVGRWKSFWRNEEMKWYVMIIVGGVLVFMGLFALKYFFGTYTDEQIAAYPNDIESTFRTALFHTLAMVSSTGFQASNFNYVVWGTSFIIPTIILMAVGGCAGSTSGGLKISRVAVCMKNLHAELTRQLHPHAVIPVRMSRRIVSDSIILRATAFMTMYLMILIVGTFLLSCTCMDFGSALATSISAFSNTGPAIGMTGPASTYAEVPAFAKWILSAIMLVGRLEIFTVLMVVSRAFRMIRK